MAELTAGIDIGTSSVKAVAADADGNVVARARIPHEFYVPSPLRFEHDAAVVLPLAAFDVANEVIMLLDRGEDIDPEFGQLGPGWQLVECSGDGRNTGRDLLGLHEGILQTDPRGLEAQDISGL